MTQSRSFPQFSQKFDLKDVATYHVGALESAAHRSLRVYKDAFLKKYGLSGMQWYIVGTVHDAGKNGMRITDLSQRLGTTLGFMTNSVNLLESRDILRRINNAADSRSKFIVMNPTYQKTYEAVEVELRSELRKAIYKDISADELKAYIQTLQTLANIKHST